jgi:peptidylprolyl isomerase
MKCKILILLMAAVTVASSAQTPSAANAKPATASKAATTTSSAAKSAGQTPATAASITAAKLPPGVPVVKGIRKTAFSLQYQDIKIGTGAEAEPYKLYKVHYTGWLASDGRKFDSSYDHRTQLVDKDKKPVLDADGKPQYGEPQPLTFPQGFGRLIPGWDQGFYGMKIGGKRRLFIPWQLAYGAKGRTINDPKNPGIPPKTDLIFDVELLDVTDIPTQSAASAAAAAASKAQSATTAAKPATATPAATAAPAATTTPAAPATPATPAAPAQPQSK